MWTSSPSCRHQVFFYLISINDAAYASKHSWAASDRLPTRSLAAPSPPLLLWLNTKNHSHLASPEDQHRNCGFCCLVNNYDVQSEGAATEHWPSRFLCPFYFRFEAFLSFACARGRAADAAAQLTKYTTDFRWTIDASVMYVGMNNGCCCK